MSYTDFDFPHTRFYQSDLREVLSKVKSLETEYNTFIAANTLSFADPIEWDITTQYSKNTIVIDSDGNAYLSLQAVPVDIELSNGDYWLEIFNFTDYITTANKNFTVNVEQNTTRASADYDIDDWILWNNVLYKAIVTISEDDTLTVDTNIERFTVEEFIKEWIDECKELIEEYEETLESTISTTTASLQAQLDEAISGATVDSEVINARVGADSVTYNTLGEAIRTQVGYLNDAVLATSITTGSDLDDIIDVGWYNIPNAAVLDNCPISSGRRMLYVNKASFGSLGVYQQILFSASDGEIYMRAYHDGAFDDWYNYTATRADAIEESIENENYTLYNNLYALIENDYMLEVDDFRDLTFAANTSTVTSRQYILEHQSVTAGERILVAMGNTKVLTNDSYFNYIGVRVQEYDSSNTSIKYHDITTSYTYKTYTLDEDCDNISIAVIYQVPAHTSAFTASVRTQCEVYELPLRFTEPLDYAMKANCGLNAERKCVDHGGFYTTVSNVDVYQNSPLAFLKAAREGIHFHNIDVVFSSDGIPFVNHDDTVTDTDGNSFTFSSSTAADIQTHTLGDDFYSWTPMTLLECDTYLKSLNGIIDMVDVSASPTAANVTDLVDYYYANNIRPAYTNWDNSTYRADFITQTNGDFGVYMPCSTVALVASAVTFIQNNSGPNYALNVLASNTNFRTPFESAGYPDILSRLNVKIYGYMFGSSNYTDVPNYLDGILSQDSNVNYLLWKANCTG